MPAHQYPNFKSWTLSLLLGSSFQNAQAVIVYGFDEVVTIDTTVNDFIRANRNSQLTFESGADIQGTNGADVTILATQNSAVTINDGSFINDVVSLDNSNIIINDGLLQDDLIADFGGTITVNGGTVADDVESFNIGSSITLLDGTFQEDVEAAGQSSITIRGGNYDSTFSRIRSADNATITIYGSGFSVEGDLAPDGVIAEEFGILTGTLADGTFFDVFFDQNPSLDFDDPLGTSEGTIVLVTIPEPSLPLLGLISLFTLLTSRTRRITHS